MKLETSQPFLILAAVALGLSLAFFEPASRLAAPLVLPLLMAMLACVFLAVPLRRFGRAVRDGRFAAATLGVNFLWTPLLAWGLGALLLRDRPELWVGLIMLLVTPCTDWYLIFTAMARGDVPRAAAMLPWNLLLQVLLLPLYLLVLAGTVVDLDATATVLGVAFVLGVPLAIGSGLRAVLVRIGGVSWFARRATATASSAQVLLLAAAVAAMFASQGQALVDDPAVVARLLPALLLFFAINLALGQWLGRRLNYDHQLRTAMTFTVLARNSPLALAIAVAAFPDQPLIALALVVGSLIELPTLAIIATCLRPRASVARQAAPAGRR